MSHPKLSDGADEEALLRQQSLFMQSRARHAPAARIFKRERPHQEEKGESAQVKRDIISLEPGLSSSFLSGGTQVHPPVGGSKHQAVDPYAARVAEPKPSGPERAPAGGNPRTEGHGSNRENVDKFDTAGVISGIIEREFGSVGAAAVQPTYTPPVLNRQQDSFTAKNGFPEVFKHSTADGPSRFRRQRHGVKKKKSVFASMLAEARAKEASAIEAAEAENAFNDGWREEESTNVSSASSGSSIGGSLAREIHSENMKKLASMSPAEIAEAQASLMRMISPKTLDAIRKKKGQHAHGSVAPKQSPSTEAETDTKTPPVTATNLSNITRESELFERAKNTLSVLDLAKLDWTKDAKVPSTSLASAAKQGEHGEVRFDLEGIPVACDADPQQLLGLHHHGRNPTAAGYAIDELLHLSRSSHTAQRTMALRALTGLLKRRAVALVNIKNVSPSTNFAVLPRQLPDATLSILHMCFPLAAPAGVASLSFLSVAVDAMHAWLVPPQQGTRHARRVHSTTFRGFEGLPPMLHAQHTQSGHFASMQCRLDTDGHHKDEIDFLGHEDGSVARVQTGVTSADGNEEESAAERKARLDRQGSQRPVYWLLRRKFCIQMGVMIRVLGELNDNGQAVQKCIEMITFCAQHSTMAAARVSKCRNLLDAIKLVCLIPEGVGMNDKASNGLKQHQNQDAKFGPSIAAMELLAVLCQSGKPIAQQLSRSGVLSLLKRFIIVPATQTGGKPTPKQNRQCEAALQVWRICLIYGIDTQDCMTVLLQSPRLAPLMSSVTSSSNRHALFPQYSVQIAVYQVLEALCRPKLHSEDAQAQLSHFIEHQCAIVLHRLQSVEEECDNDRNSENNEVKYGLSSAANKVTLMTGGAAAHFLASAISRGHLKAIYASAAGIKTCEVNKDDNVGARLLNSSFLSKMMSSSSYVDELMSNVNADQANPSDVNALLGYVRLAQALSRTAMLSQSAVQTAQAAGKRLLTWMLDADTLELKKLASLSLEGDRAMSVVDVNAYNQRSRVFLIDALVEFTRQDNSLSPFIQINAALLCLPLILPGDESVALRMLSQGLLDIENLASLWAASGEGEPIPRKELLELRAILYPYFRAFLGDSNCLKRSKSLEVPSHSIQTLFLTPRIFGQQQSTLPLPPHWLYLPLFDEDDDEATGVGMNDFSSLSAMVAGLTFVWKLEMCKVTSSYGSMSKIPRELQIFAVLQVALSKENFIFDPTSGNALATLLELYLGEQTRDNLKGEMNRDGEASGDRKEVGPFDFESVLGCHICEGLASRVVSRYVQDPRCHTSPFYTRVLHTLMRSDIFDYEVDGAGYNCRTRIWQTCTESKMVHALESVCARGLFPLLEHNIPSKNIPAATKSKLIKLYCTALRQSLWHRRNDCPRAYGLALQAASSFIFEWAGKDGEDASNYEWTRRDLFESFSRGGANPDLTKALIECGDIDEISGMVQTANEDTVRQRWEWIKGRMM